MSVTNRKYSDDLDDIDHIVSESNKDVDTMKESLAKLSRLSEDDKTEKAMLRSRIDEQCQLIMILKKKTDDSTIKLQTIERINKELIEFRESAQDTLNLEIHKCNLLEKRFNELASNHEEMIKIKDEYKRVNQELRHENMVLKDDNRRLFSKTIDEKNLQIADLDKKYYSMKEQYSDLEKQFRQAQQSFKTREEAYKTDMKTLQESSRAELKTLQSKLNDTEERLKSATYKLQNQMESKTSADAEAKNRITQLTKEKDEMLELAMQRGKLIQKEQGENKVLQKKIVDMEKAVKNMQEKFEKEAASVNANLQVRKLKDELRDADFKYEEISREFTAFKKHSNNLLQKEKDLNERLRHLVG